MGDDNTTEYNDVIAQFDKDSRKLSIRINNLNLSDRYIYVELEYQTKITKIPEESGDGTTVGSDKITFENKVNVGGKDYSGQVEMSSKELDKKGKQVEGLSNVIEYSITVNSSAAALNPEKGTLELTDVLDTNLILDTTSIKVKDMTGETVNYQPSFGTTADGKNTMRLILPDRKALVVTYRASLVSAGKENGNSYQVSNNATLIGATRKTVEQTTSVKYESTGATVAGNQNSIVIKKVDENGHVLSGAEFAVQEVNPVDLSPKEPPVTIIRSDKNGYAKFEGLKLNTLYYYQETKAPTGYQGDMGKKYFVIQSLKDDDEKKAFNTLTSSLKKEDIKYAVISGGNTFLLENKKVSGELTVEKTVSDNAKEKVKDGSSVIFGTGWESAVSNGIVPRSVWTLGHRPKCSPEGMVYLGGGTWVDIYLNSDDGAKGLKSEYGCAPMTGTESMNWYNFVERLAKSGKRLPNYAEFCAYAFGSPAGLDNANTNAWSATSNTGRGVTGSVVNAVSSVGVVDAVGRVWEWLDELITRAEHATNADYHASVAWGWDKKSPLNTGEKSYDVGNIYQYYAYSLAALIAGGRWADGAICGARAVGCSDCPWRVGTAVGARGACDSL